MPEHGGQSFALIYSIEDPLATLPTRGVGAQVMGPDDSYIVQYSRDVSRFWADPRALSLGACFSGTGVTKSLLPAQTFRQRVMQGYQASASWHQGGWYGTLFFCVCCPFFIAPCVLQYLVMSTSSLHFLITSPSHIITPHHHTSSPSHHTSAHTPPTGSLVASPPPEVPGTLPASTVQQCSWEFDVQPVYGWGETSGRQKATAGWLAALPVFEPHWQVCIGVCVSVCVFVCA